MKVSELFKFGVEAGIEADSRKIAENIEFEELCKLYQDSAIHHDSRKEIKKVFVGIDCELQELLLADKLGAECVLAHHPEGKALVNLWKVMDIHREAIIDAGVSVNAAERMVEERQDEVRKSFHGSNYNRACDGAKLLNLSFINIHTPADNLANKFMQNYIEKEGFFTLKEICEGVKKLPEYEFAALNGVIPKIVSGSDKYRAGKFFVKFNGGTSGSKKLFKSLETAGISTFICMHLPEAQIEEAKKHSINVIIMPHMASDSLGMNLLIDNIIEKSKFEFDVIAGSGFTRVSRRQK